MKVMFLVGACMVVLAATGVACDSGSGGSSASDTGGNRHGGADSVLDAAGGMDDQGTGPELVPSDDAAAPDLAAAELSPGEALVLDSSGDAPSTSDLESTEIVPDVPPADLPPDVPAEDVEPLDAGPAPFVLGSSDFEDGGTMKAPNVCSSYQDLGVSPELHWSGAPEGTLSFALTCVDPDGSNWVHWILWDLPGYNETIPGAFPAELESQEGVVQGINDFGDPGYGGPCPPPNGVHHYHFTLYALDVESLELPGGTTTFTQLSEAVESHVLAQAVLVGLYEKK